MVFHITGMPQHTLALSNFVQRSQALQVCLGTAPRMALPLSPEQDVSDLPALDIMTVGLGLGDLVSLAHRLHAQSCFAHEDDGRFGSGRVPQGEGL